MDSCSGGGAQKNLFQNAISSSSLSFLIFSTSANTAPSLVLSASTLPRRCVSASLNCAKDVMPVAPTSTAVPAANDPKHKAVPSNNALDATANGVRCSRRLSLKCSLRAMKYTPPSAPAAKAPKDAPKKTVLLGNSKKGDGAGARRGASALPPRRPSLIRLPLAPCEYSRPYTRPLPAPLLSDQLIKRLSCSDLLLDKAHLDFR